MNQALTDVGWGVGANAFSSYLANKAKVGPVGEEMLAKGIEAGTKFIRTNNK